MFFIEPILGIILLVSIACIPYIKKHLYEEKISKKEIKFNEFDDVEKVS